MKEIKNVPGLNPEDVVVIKKYTYGDQAKLGRKITKLSLNDIKQGKRGEQDSDIYAAMIYPLVYGIIKAPFFTPGFNEEKKVLAIEELSPETGKFLINEVKEYNNLGEGDDIQKK